MLDLEKALSSIDNLILSFGIPLRAPTKFELEEEMPSPVISERGLKRSIEPAIQDCREAYLDAVSQRLDEGEELLTVDPDVSGVVDAAFDSIVNMISGRCDNPASPEILSWALGRAMLFADKVRTTIKFSTLAPFFDEMVKTSVLSSEPVKLGDEIEVDSGYEDDPNDIDVEEDGKAVKKTAKQIADDVEYERVKKRAAASDFYGDHDLEIQHEAAKQAKKIETDDPLATHFQGIDSDKARKDAAGRHVNGGVKEIAEGAAAGRFRLDKALTLKIDETGNFQTSPEDDIIFEAFRQYRLNNGRIDPRVLDATVTMYKAKNLTLMQVLTEQAIEDYHTPRAFLPFLDATAVQNVNSDDVLRHFRKVLNTGNFAKASIQDLCPNFIQVIPCDDHVIEEAIQKSGNLYAQEIKGELGSIEYSIKNNPSMYLTDIIHPEYRRGVDPAVIKKAFADPAKAQEIINYAVKANPSLGNVPHTEGVKKMLERIITNRNATLIDAEFRLEKLKLTIQEHCDSSDLSYGEYAKEEVLTPDKVAGEGYMEQRRKLLRSAMESGVMPEALPSKGEMKIFSSGHFVTEKGERRWIKGSWKDVDIDKWLDLIEIEDYERALEKGEKATTPLAVYREHARILRDVEKALDNPGVIKNLKAGQSPEIRELVKVFESHYEPDYVKIRNRALNSVLDQKSITLISDKGLLAAFGAYYKQIPQVVERKRYFYAYPPLFKKGIRDSHIVTRQDILKNIGAVESSGVVIDPDKIDETPEIGSGEAAVSNKDFAKDTDDITGKGAQAKGQKGMDYVKAELKALQELHPLHREYEVVNTLDNIGYDVVSNDIKRRVSFVAAEKDVQRVVELLEQDIPDSKLPETIRDNEELAKLYERHNVILKSEAKVMKGNTTALYGVAEALSVDMFMPAINRVKKTVKGKEKITLPKKIEDAKRAIRSVDKEIAAVKQKMHETNAPYADIEVRIDLELKRDLEAQRVRLERKWQDLVEEEKTLTKRIESMERLTAEYEQTLKERAASRAKLKAGEIPSDVLQSEAARMRYNVLQLAQAKKDLEKKARPLINENSRVTARLQGLDPNVAKQQAHAAEENYVALEKQLSDLTERKRLLRDAQEELSKMGGKAVTIADIGLIPDKFTVVKIGNVEGTSKMVEETISLEHLARDEKLQQAIFEERPEWIPGTAKDYDSIAYRRRAGFIQHIQKAATANGFAVTPCDFEALTDRLTFAKVTYSGQTEEQATKTLLKLWEESLTSSHSLKKMESGATDLIIDLVHKEFTPFMRDNILGTSLKRNSESLSKIWHNTITKELAKYPELQKALLDDQARVTRVSIKDAASDEDIINILKKYDNKPIPKSVEAVKAAATEGGTWVDRMQSSLKAFGAMSGAEKAILGGAGAVGVLGAAALTAAGLGIWEEWRHPRDTAGRFRQKNYGQGYEPYRTPPPQMGGIGNAYLNRTNYAYPS